MALTSFLVIWLLVVIAYALEDPQEYNYSDHAASKCCSLITALTASKSQARSPTALNGVIACLNQSISSIYRFVQQANVPYTASPTPKQGPSRAIAVITRITPEIYSYAAYSTFLQIHWAQRQGYSYIPFMDTYDANKERRKGYNDDYRYHRKLTLILEVLKVPSVYRDIDEYGKSRGEKVHRDVKRLRGMAYTADYVMWMDADAVPLDPSYGVEGLITEYPDAHLLISADSSSVANTGIFIMRNSDWSVTFLELWLSLRLGLVEEIVNIHTQEAVHYHGTEIDQSGFASAVELYQKRYGLEYVSTYIQILPAHRLNSIPPAMSLQQSDHKWLHLAAEDDGYRKAVFQEGASQVCRAVTHPGPHNNNNDDSENENIQTGMHQPFLVRTAVQYYSQYTKTHLQKLREILGYSKGTRPGQKSGSKGSEGEKESSTSSGDGSTSTSNGSGVRTVVMNKSSVGYDLTAVRTIVSKYCHALKHSLAASSTPNQAVAESLRGVKIRYEVYQLMREWVDVAVLVTNATTNITSTRFNYEKIDASFYDSDDMSSYGGIFDYGEGGGDPLEKLYGDLDRDGERFEGKNTSVPLALAEGSVEVHHYRGCYDEEIFEDPNTYDPSLPKGQRSDPSKAVRYCKTNILDAVLMSLPDTMKLTAELVYDYMHALESITDDVYSSFLNENSVLDVVGKRIWPSGYLLSMSGNGIQPINTTNLPTGIPREFDNRNGNRHVTREGEIWHVATYLLSLLDHMLDIIASAQAGLVLEMKANLYIELAELTYAKAREGNDGIFSSNMNRSSLYIHRALDIYTTMKQRGKESGVDMRIKTQGMSLLAMIECQQMNYTGGLALFDSALAIDAAWLGTLFHPSLMHRFYNAITCSLQKQQHTLRYKAMPDSNAEKDLRFIKELFQAVITTYEGHRDDIKFAREFKDYYELAKEKYKIQW